MMANQCPRCGSDTWRRLWQCFDCGHRQFDAVSAKETNLRPWQVDMIVAREKRKRF